MNSRSSWCAPWCTWRCSRRVYSWKRRYPILRRSLSYPSISSLQHELRFEQPCTQDLRSCASQDTVQSEQRSLEKRGLIYRTGSFAKGTQEAHRSPCCSANVFIRPPIATEQRHFISAAFGPQPAVSAVYSATVALRSSAARWPSPA